MMSYNLMEKLRTSKTLGKLRGTFLWTFGQTVYRFFLSVSDIHTCLRHSRMQNDGERTIFVMVPSLSGGGAERVATVIASELSRLWHVVLIYANDRKPFYPVSEAVETVKLPFMAPEPKFYEKIRLRLVRKLKKRREPLISLSFLSGMNLLNVNSKVREKTVCCERNDPTKAPQDARRIDVIRSVYERADHVIFQTAAVRDLFSETVRAHSSILPNPVAVPCLREAPLRHRIVTMGRLGPQKNHAMLIRAFSRFHAFHPDYTLSICGEGYLRKELTALIGELGLRDHVFLEGRLVKVHEAIRDAEIFVLSSDFEGFSNALLEAMMMGFPCVSTDCEGSKEVIEDGKNGLLVPRGDEDALFRAMLRLAEDPEFRESLGRAAKTTSQRFLRENAAREWMEALERI